MIELNGTIIAVILNFLLLVWLLNYFMYKPVQQILAERQKAIEDNIRDAEEKAAQAAGLKTDYEKKLSAAQTKMQEMLNSAQVTSDKIISDAAVLSKKDSESRAAQAQKEAERIKADAVSSARKDIADLVCAAAGKLIKVKIDQQADRSIVDGFIKEIEGAEIN